MVSGSLTVHGLAGLGSADASVMLSSTSDNSNAPVIANAERTTVMIMAQTR